MKITLGNCAAKNTPNGSLSYITWIRVALLKSESNPSYVTIETINNRRFVGSTNPNGSAVSSWKYFRELEDSSRKRSRRRRGGGALLDAAGNEATIESAQQ